MSGVIRKLFRWREVPPPPLTGDELLKFELAFIKCDKDCPVAIMFWALIGHINWQKKHLNDARENYEK